LGEMQRANKATEKAGKVSSGTLQATIENLHLDQRPWLSIKEIVCELGQSVNLYARMDLSL